MKRELYDFFSYIHGEFILLFFAFFSFFIPSWPLLYYSLLTFIIIGYFSSGLVVCSSLRKGKKLIENKTFKQNSKFLQTIFEIGRLVFKEKPFT